jgi:hypothetical protein
MKAHEVEDHVFSTYLSLRFGMAVIALAFPFLMVAIGKLNGVPLQDSLSAYYWQDGASVAPVRNWFVGGLFALAAFLYLYKGFTDAENWALNLAAIFAIGVATMPMAWPPVKGDGWFSTHGVSAISLFACLWYVVLFRAKDTLRFLPASLSVEERASTIRWYGNWYSALGAIMVVSPLGAVLISTVLGKPSALVLFVEATGVMSFGTFWAMKSREMRLSKLTRRALRGEIAVDPFHANDEKIQ